MPEFHGKSNGFPGGRGSPRREVFGRLARWPAVSNFHLRKQQATVQPVVFHEITRTGGANAIWTSKVHAALKSALPHPSAVGAPASDALWLLRQLEDSSRQTWGGAVGYLTPGGAASLVLADEVIVAQHNSFWCTVGAQLTEATDPLTAADLANASARRRLAAIAAAVRAAASK